MRDPGAKSSVRSAQCRREWRAIRKTAALVLLPLLLGGFAPGATGTSCSSLVALTLPHVNVLSAVDTPAGPFTPPGAPPSLIPPILPAFCRVVAVSTPTADSTINFEVWIPPAGTWNGKFQGVGNGAFEGAIGYAAMATALGRGYATASTDTGHTGGDLKFGEGHPEKIVDWAYRSIHEMTGAAKAIVGSYAGQFPARSYFTGCATGGHQALSEAQRFPADYDGIVAGNPAADRTNEILYYLWAWMATHTGEAITVVPPAKLRLITKAAVAACDAVDGVADGVIDDPRRCRFDPAMLLCRDAGEAACLTRQELDAVKKVYGGLRNPRTGTLIFPGWPLGSEAYGERAGEGWRGSVLDLPEPRRVDFFRYFVFNDPRWNWRSIDWDRDVAYTNARMGFINATGHDLSAFRARGGKLLMYTGWVDPILPAEDVLHYYDEVVKTSGRLENTAEFFRLFMAPGMGHCNGGPGPNVFDALGPLEQWVERGVAPETILASHVTNGVTDRTRPLCAYPLVARWKGTGSTDDAANFVCTTGGPPRRPDPNR